MRVWVDTSVLHIPHHEPPDNVCVLYEFQPYSSVKRNSLIRKPIVVTYLFLKSHLRMQSKFCKLFTLMSCIATVVSADYWTFTLNRYRCFEPREWTTDRVHFQFSLVTRGQNGQVAQNITKYRGSSSLVDRGDASDPNVMWQDITIPETETDLLVTSSMWNVGDGDPQKVGFRKCE